MFSQKIYADILRVTQRALVELHSLNAVDQVTIAQGYAQLAQSGADYDGKLRRSIERLLDLAKKENQRQLAEEFEGLVQEMDQDRACRVVNDDAVDSALLPLREDLRPDDVAKEPGAGRVEQEVPLDRLLEVARFHRLAVRVAQAFAKGEAIRPLVP